jgi:hypothetical protein
MASAAEDITGLLLAWNGGDQEAFEKLLPVAKDKSGPWAFYFSDVVWTEEDL